MDAWWEKAGSKDHPKSSYDWTGRPRSVSQILDSFIHTSSQTASSLYSLKCHQSHSHIYFQSGPLPPPLTSTIYFFFLILGDSMNTVPHYNKLWRLVSHIWGNHRGQHIWSAVDEPCPGQTTFMITVSLLSGKYAALLLTMSELSNCVPFFWFPLLPSVTYH